MRVICLSGKDIVICWPLWDPIRYEATHDMPVEASDCPECIYRNMLTPLDPLNTLLDLPIRFAGLYMLNSLLDTTIFVLFYVIIMKKWDFFLTPPT